MLDPYLDEAGVFINKLGIGNTETLESAEAELTSVRMAEISTNPISGNFDFKHLKALHKKVFSDLYSWAGESRKGDISKGTTMFCRAEHIESFAKSVFCDIQKDDRTWQVSPNSCKEMPNRLAHHFSELNALHPFREGNGRVQKLFVSLLAEKHGFSIDWSKMTRKEMLDASIESISSEPKKLTQLIMANMRSIKNSSQNSISQKL